MVHMAGVRSECSKIDENDTVFIIHDEGDPSVGIWDWQMCVHFNDKGWISEDERRLKQLKSALIETLGDPATTRVSTLEEYEEWEDRERRYMEQMEREYMRED